jgi:hypothetical protein
MEAKMKQELIVRRETQKLRLAVVRTLYSMPMNDFESKIRVYEVDKTLAGKEALDVISSCDNNGIYDVKNNKRVVSVGYLPSDFCKETEWFEAEDHSAFSYGDWFTESLLDNAGPHQVNFSFEEYVQMGKPSELEEEIIHSYSGGKSK